MQQHNFKYIAPSREKMEAFYNLISSVSDTKLAAHLEKVYDLAALLAESPHHADAISQWDTIMKMIDSLKQYPEVNPEIMNEVNNFVSYIPSLYIEHYLNSTNTREKIALPLHFTIACQFAEYIHQPTEGTSIDTIVFLNYASGLFELTKEHVTHGDPFLVTLGYGTSRLLEERIKEFSFLHPDMIDLKNAYKEFRKKIFVKPRLNKSWPQEKTFFKGCKVAIGISARDFRDRKTYYKDRNTVASLVEKLGGKVTLATDKSAKYIISNDRTSTAKTLSESAFSDLVKKEMPQVPLHLASGIRAYIRYDDFETKINKPALHEYGFSDQDITFLYQEIQDMIRAVTMYSNGIYKLTGI
jgi:hypothetical protein